MTRTLSELEKMVKDNRKMIWILVVLIFIVGSVSAQEFNQSDRVVICDFLNFSYVECYNFWDSYENVNSSCNIDISNYVLKSDFQNCSNSTEYVVNSSCNNLDDLELIDQYAIRGFDPEFTNGRPSGWIKQNVINSSCGALDCTEECSKAVQTIRDQIDNDGSSGENNNTAFWALVGLGIFCFFAYKFLPRLLDKKNAIVPSKIVEPVDFPEPPKPVCMLKKEAEEKEKKFRLFVKDKEEEEEENKDKEF